VPSYVGPADKLGAARIGLKNESTKDEEGGNSPTQSGMTEKGAVEHTENSSGEIREAEKI